MKKIQPTIYIHTYTVKNAGYFAEIPTLLRSFLRSFLRSLVRSLVLLMIVNCASNLTLTKQFTVNKHTTTTY